MTTERSSQWPVSKTPNGNYTETDVTTTTDAEAEAIAVRCRGINAGQPVLIIAVASITSGANTDSITLRMYQDALGGDTVGEDVDTSHTASTTVTQEIMVFEAAYQTNPIYVLGVTTVNATANSTINSSGIVVIPIRT